MSITEEPVSKRMAMKRKRRKKGKTQAGGRTPSLPANAATNDKKLGTYLREQAQDSIALTERLIAYRAAHPIVRSVPDAPTEKEFLKYAKQIYREAHSLSQKRGPRVQENFAIVILSQFSRSWDRPLTQGEMVKVLMTQGKLSINTAHKYAKLFRLSKQETMEFSKAEQRWLCKEFGSESLSPSWWTDRDTKWFAALVNSSGLGEEIRKIFAGEYTPEEIQQMHAEMLMLKEERMALARQGTGSTNGKDVVTKEQRPRSKKSRSTPG